MYPKRMGRMGNGLPIKKLAIMPFFPAQRCTFSKRHE